MKTGLTVTMMAALLFSATTFAQEAVEKKPELKEQTTCPVMGGKINKQQYVDHEGQRIYVCCAGCIQPIEADPAKYLEILKKQGVTLYDTPKIEKE